MTKRKLTLTEKVRRYYEKFPNAKYADVAYATGADIKHLYVIKNKLKATGRLAKTPAGVVSTITTDESLTPTKPYIPMLVEMFEPTPDPVNHPEHYKVGGIETIDFIEAKKLNYNIGNVVKYLTRADHKGNRKQDLEKAMWYLTREINSLK